MSASPLPHALTGLTHIVGCRSRHPCTASNFPRYSRKGENFRFNLRAIPQIRETYARTMGWTIKSSGGRYHQLRIRPWHWCWIEDGSKSFEIGKRYSRWCEGWIHVKLSLILARVLAKFSKTCFLLTDWYPGSSLEESKNMKRSKIKIQI